MVLTGRGVRGMEILMAQNKYVIGHGTALSGAQRDSVLRIARASLDRQKKEIPWMKSFPSYYRQSPRGA